MSSASRSNPPRDTPKNTRGLIGVMVADADASVPVSFVSVVVVFVVGVEVVVAVVGVEVAVAVVVTDELLRLQT